MAKRRLRRLAYIPLFALATACSDGDKNPVDSEREPVEDGIEQRSFYDLDFTQVFKDPSFREDQLLFSYDFERDYPGEYRKLTHEADYSGQLKVSLIGVVPILKVARDQGMRVPLTPLEARFYEGQGVVPAGVFRDGQGSEVAVEFIGPEDGRTYLGVKDLSSTTSGGYGFSPRRIFVNGNEVVLDPVSPETTRESMTTLEITKYVKGGRINVVTYAAADGDGQPTDLFLNRLVISSSEPFSDNK
ncbi:hypothetical protein HYT57_00530 [Candidatus Woesearchaeota archaeon]|nr:hypothetical protein [Candidatus Woesearchaeota archaeon]